MSSTDLRHDQCGFFHTSLLLVHQDAEEFQTRVSMDRPWAHARVLTLDSLIMLLIQSDMFKALWFMLYPIVTFTTGPVPSNSKFCQVNGFFISLGIEASGTGQY
jgi:hypothetical protein